MVQESQGKVSVMAGTGSNNTEEAIELTKHALKVGANYSLQVAPYYNKPTQEGFFRHFEKIATEVDIPIIVYNIAGRTGKNIETETIKRLSEIPNVAGVKEASGDIAQMMDVYNQTPDDFALLCGDDNLTLPLISLGGDGVISVASNFIPSKITEMVKSALDGNFTKAKELHYELLPIFKAVFLETNPIPAKFMTSLVIGSENNLRLPMTPLSPENESKCKKVMKNLELIN